LLFSLISPCSSNSWLSEASLPFSTWGQECANSGLEGSNGSVGKR